MTIIDVYTLHEGYLGLPLIGACTCALALRQAKHLVIGPIKGHGPAGDPLEKDVL